MPHRIHPTAVVSDGVELGEDVVVGPYAVVLGPTRIGDRCWIAPHACVGAPPEHRDHTPPPAWDGDVRWAGEGPGLVIGDGVTLREFCTVQLGTAQPTVVGDDCFLTARAHVAHDAVLGAGVTMAPGAAVAGHAVVGRGTTLGMGAAVHQRTVVGPGAMVGMASAVTRDVAPFTTVLGNPARVAGTNAVALRRLGADEELVAHWPDVLAGRTGPAGLPPAVRERVREWEAAVADRGPA